MSIVFPLPNRDSVNLDVPNFTLDVNQIPVKPPHIRPPELDGLCFLEWNYFDENRVELCVTPETEVEITQGLPQAPGTAAYARFVKSELFKRRPPEAMLRLSDGEANELWEDMRDSMWRHVEKGRMTSNQIADVNQVFYHAISSGSTAENSFFVTLDRDFLDRASRFHERYGVTILTPNDAWERSLQRYGLSRPTTSQLDDLWDQQARLFREIHLSSGWSMLVEG